MAATPRYGTAVFKGASGRVYNVDVYVSDVAGALVNWDAGNGASSTSLNYWKAPEVVTLGDISLASGLADTTNIVMTSDGAQIPGARLRYANYLNSLAFRPAINLSFRAGSNVSAIQVA